MIPEIIRCLYRISFGLRLDKSTMKIDFGTVPPLLRFRELADGVIEVFKKENILMYYCGTMSSFNTDVDIKLQLQFLDLDRVIPIPREIIDCLALSLNSNMVQSEKALLLGYLGRTINGDGKLITDGLALDNNSFICLDLTTHSVVPVCTTGYRITHELLHTLGITEEQEKGLDWQMYMAQANTITPFARIVQEVIPDSIDYMNKRVKGIEESSATLLNELWNIEREMSKNQIGISEQAQICTEIYHPVFSVSSMNMDVPVFDQPIPDVKGFQIPFA